MDKKEMSGFPAYRVFDVEHWARKDHFQYYTEVLPVSYSMTVRLDVTGLLDWCHRAGKKFYPMVIYCVSKTVNELEFLRMFRDHAGRLCVWEEVHPNYTVFHPDDKTFSDVWSHYDADAETFYRTVTEDMATYGEVHGVKAREGQPPNFYCVSMVPWFDYTGYATASTNQSTKLFPIVTCGKYVPSYEVQADGSVKERRTMSVTLTVSHAVSDGYHTGVFFETLQKEMDRFGPGMIF